MLKKLESLEGVIGNTPMIKLEHEKINLYAKLEYYNLMNSVKVRAAYHILKSAISRGEVTENSTIIESSSGNFAVALATLCRYIGLKFIPVIDPNINGSYENFLRATSYQVAKVDERDETGGYLLTRLNKVKELLNTIPNAYWTNQYNNADNFEAHYQGIGGEISNDFKQLDYAFIGVSTGGTIAGVSIRLKEKFPNIKIIAVDSQGSTIFGDKPRKRYIPGIGASMVPGMVKKALIDDVMIVPEVHTVAGCYELFNKHAIFAGGSSGTSYYAIQKYFENKDVQNTPNVVFLCPDNGQAYTSTIYNVEWVEWLNTQKSVEDQLVSL
ncbi:TPA: 2,3-diaminopropionate biosynthesis protein SbnA [Bacillus cereus]|uniref:2,3-diaminopropionate biosynthesis protein SbnA n=1 Tax=Bacillus cereus group TaxID=86661 RepID=UPI000BEE1870|nr:MULTISPECIES: 2,3-diaminopropionate biosynthesis protein SbnA [Bacillus cereus group]MEB9945294.1 2,3-diaminopropionate biosynthesis protein SbnA [Bacillus cereus]PED04589.1 2,3-diaminopropionate biosynthesis protein SbnA [Bacillus cereus]PEQ37163.1 2,3-diaminopropionate biosynthesis protein SbnA [Bacillus cereus]PEQ73052.1 2,3-diaminopropionate biosynthesis protein SbnA [Bacillus cereus]PES06273.1 2,3-diaminopropionate biosynthesis protein SbnA [Bacillus cereus]